MKVRDSGFESEGATGVKFVKMTIQESQTSMYLESSTYLKGGGCEPDLERREITGSSKRTFRLA